MARLLVTSMAKYNETVRKGVCPVQPIPLPALRFRSTGFCVLFALAWAFADRDPVASSEHHGNISAIRIKMPYRMLRQLDWDTSLNKVNIADHWRVLLCAAVGAVPATLIWHTFFPHTFWFIKLWTGFATGATAGVFPGLWWQVRDNERRPSTSGRFAATCIFGWGALAVISVFCWMPDLHAQEKERARIRSLAVADISSISIRIDGRRFRHIQDPELFASFVACSKHAELFYPSHEGSTIKFQIVIFRNNGSSLEYDGRVPERHQDDFSLEFRGYFVSTEIIVPGGREWLDSLAN